MSRRVEAMKRLLDKGTAAIDRMKGGEVKIRFRGRSHFKLHVSEEVAAEPAPGLDEALEPTSATAEASP